MNPHEQLVDVGEGISLCFETFGDRSDPPLLLIAGLGQQLLAWPTELCRSLAERGLFVIRFDNRDVGRSTMIATPPPASSSFVTHRWRPEQYTLADMTRDTAGLLRALDLPAAHVVGMSMGGMIGQTLAAKHPELVLSLTSIMSTTGARKIGRPALSTWRLMARRPPRGRAAAIEANVRIYRHIASRGFPFDEAATRALAEQAWERGHSAAGVSRQLGAIFKSRDRTRELAAITAPTLVIHGDHDQMVHPSGGAATAAAIRGARLETFAGLGHDLPAGAWPRLLDLFSSQLQAATPATERATAG